MNKKDAIHIFGSQAETARAIGCTRASVNGWPDPLPRRIADRVIAACVRTGIDPTRLLESERENAIRERHMKTIQITMSDEKYQLLKNKAKAEGISVDALIFLALSCSYWTKDATHTNTLPHEEAECA